MSSPVTADSPARRRLTIVPHVEDEAPVAATPVLSGTIIEVVGPLLTLFRFSTGGRPSVIDIPTELCSLDVRDKLYDLLLAIEREATSRVAGPALVVGLTPLQA